MGICFSNNFRKINNSIIPSNNFHEIRKILIDFIHTFHTVKRSCVIGYNDSIQKSLRQTAEILLKIQRYIKNCLKTLRDYIKRVDHAIEFPISGNEKLNFIHEIQNVITNLEFRIAVNDIKKIINPSTDPLFIEKISEMIEKKNTGINMEEIHNKIDLKILQIKDQNDERKSFRRKYSRIYNNFYSKV